jgi:hypothetical protein
MGVFTAMCALGILVNEDGECLERRHFEPRGNAETAGWRPTGHNSMQPAKREGLAEALRNTEPVQQAARQ